VDNSLEGGWGVSQPAVLECGRAERWEADVTERLAACVRTWHFGDASEFSLRLSVRRRRSSGGRADSFFGGVASGLPCAKRGMRLVPAGGWTDDRGVAFAQTRTWRYAAWQAEKVKTPCASYAAADYYLCLSSLRL